MEITVRHDVSRARRELRSFRGDAPRAVTRALNRTIKTVEVAAVRAIAADTGLTNATVRKTIEIRPATFARLEARIIATGRRLPLLAFRARQVRQGVSYALGRGRQLARSAFIATMRSGHRGVFRRRTKARLPIIELRGPSLPRVFAQAKIATALRALATATFPKNLAHEVAFERRRRGAA